MPTHTRDLSNESSTSTVVEREHPSHKHDSGKTCPFLAQLHANEAENDVHTYCPPQKDDLRSVCPALNTMANHGYISRDGRSLTFGGIYSGLKACYGLSSALAFVLTIGGFLLIKRSPVRVPSWVPFFGKVKNPDGTKSAAGVIDLHLIGLHGGVEHDASLVHPDTEPGQLYPSIQKIEPWITQLVGDVQPPVHGYDQINEKVGAKGLSSAWKLFASSNHDDTLVSASDVAQMRKRREQEILPKTLDGVHAEIARGEMAIVLGMWEKTSSSSDDGQEPKHGVPLPWLLKFLAEERLPEDGKWRPDHTQGLLDVVNRSKAIRQVQYAK